MKLKVLGRYSNEPRGLVYAEGQIIEVDEGLAAYLLGDSPGSFEEYKAPVKRRTKRVAQKDDE